VFSVLVLYFFGGDDFLSFSHQLGFSQILLDFLVFDQVFSSFLNGFVFVQDLQPAVVSVFDLVVGAISQLLLNVFPLFSVLIDALDDFEVFLDGPVVPLNFGSEIINIPLLNFF
jgi:hypothetical protein